MTNDEQKSNLLVKAYNDLLSHLRDALHAVGELSQESFQIKLDYAKDRLHEYEELSREEIDHLGDYLKRDLQQASGYLSRTGQELKDWLKDDLQLAEDTFSEMYANAIDTTRIELEKFHEQAEAGDWYTGDITGPGVLVCKKCGHRLRVETTSHITPCEKCLGTVFRKEYGERETD